MLSVVITAAALFTLKTNALSLSYSGGSSSNGTGSSATTSGFSVSYDDAEKNICGYRFSIVTSNGLPKSGTKVANIYLCDLTNGNTAYYSGQRFIVSSGVVANKKQLANGTKVTSSSTTQSCDYYSTACGFYSTLAQAPSSIGSWIKNSANSYQNLQRIYYFCGSNLANAAESDYVLIEPIFWMKLAGTQTAATATELAIYGAAVSGGDQYKGTDGNLYNAGSGTLWNLSNYINREFPNTLYVSSKTDVYSAVTISTSNKYTYKQIIGSGYGCSVLTVKNVITIKKVHIAYNPNGGTVTVDTNQYGWILQNSIPYFHVISHGTSDDPYNASTFGLKKTGYHFGGWKVYSTGQILDQDTNYSSTVYADFNDSSKTTANTATVYCRLYAVWIPNTVKLAYYPNGGTTTTEKNSNGYVMLDGTVYFDTLKYGESDDPYNASTFGMQRTGYAFVGWKVYSTGNVLDEDTVYASTVYAQYNDSTKTTANTSEVTCYLYAVWEKISHTNTIEHWAWGFRGNGNNADKQGFRLATTTYTKNYAENFSLDESYACDIPNGFYIQQVFGTSAITGSWGTYPFGTTITQPASSIWAEYDYSPRAYNISYDLGGGTNDESNPDTYNVLYGVTLNNPTKANDVFLGWDIRISKNETVSLTTHNWKFNNVLYNLIPGTEYKVYIESAKLTEGSSTEFTYAIHDFTDNTTLIRQTAPLGDGISFDISCPTTADASHDIRLIFYAGVAGSTSGNSVDFSNINIQFETDGVNQGCTSVFSSADDLYTQLNKRITGDIEFIAKWERNDIFDIVILPIEPNAPYHSGTEVITSYWILNCADFDIIPTHNVCAEMIVYENESVIYSTQEENIVIPEMDKNLVYFKWNVPDEIVESKVKISCLITIDSVENDIVTEEYEVTPFTVYTTPDTRYIEKAPDGFSVPPAPAENIESGRWWKWEYTGSEFVKKEYAVTNDTTDLRLETPTNPSDYIEVGVLCMKSGYGFECNFTPSVTAVSGYESSSVSQCVAPQYFYSLFPEYNYTFGTDKCRSFNTLSGKKAFINASGMERQHFIPLYFPDGDYRFQVILSDCWTPAGMLKTTKNVRIRIDGNIYEDWYIQH